MEKKSTKTFFIFVNAILWTKNPYWSCRDVMELGEMHL